jgi:hypothetical protein
LPGNHGLFWELLKEMRQKGFDFSRGYASPVFMREPSTGKPCRGGHPVGESQNQPFQLSFHGSLKVDLQGSRVTSDGGLILVRELDERLGFIGLIEQHLTDPRWRNTRLPLADLLRQSVDSRLAGYEYMNDAERLSQVPTFRLIGSEKIWERGAAVAEGDRS